MHGSAHRRRARRKQELGGQWHGEAEALTEDLRLALRRYRTFFNQLLDA